MERIHKLIIKRFNYLVTDFDYKITEISSFPKAVYVKFCSNNCEITVYVEGFYVGLIVNPLVNISNIENENDKRFDIFDILNYIAPELNIKPKKTIFLSVELKRISFFFLTYCERIIKGDFSIWSKLIRARYESRKQRRKRNCWEKI